MSMFKDILARIDKFITNIENIVSGFGVLTITMMVFVGVVSRIFFGYTFSFIEELAQYLMVWVAVFGAMLCVRTNGHVGIDVIFSILPKKLHNLFNGILSLISAVFLFWLTVISYDYVLVVKATNQLSVSMRWFPMYVLYLSVVIGGALMCFEYIKMCISLLKKGFKGEIEEKNVSIEDMEKV